MKRKEKKSIWLLTQTILKGYDYYDSAVVVAKNEVEARKINIDRRVGYDYVTSNRELVEMEEWVEPEFISVEYLGKAASGTKSGVILASYNAG